MKLLGLTRCHGVRGVLARVEHGAIITADRAIVARSQSCAARCRSVVPAAAVQIDSWISAATQGIATS